MTMVYAECLRVLKENVVDGVSKIRYININVIINNIIK